jgi:predicted nucleotidyltransferase component of viral defense system
MDAKIRKAQQQILKVFAKKAKDFALAGGTALEIYYLNHRFSADLDFFSPKYQIAEINNLVSAFNKELNKNLKLESEFIASSRAKVRFYTMLVKGSERPLKIDFVEDVFFDKPVIKKFDGLRVYSVENLYLQKISAVCGTRPQVDELGRLISQGRGQARDAFDLYVLSKKIQPLHIFLKNIPSQFQRGMVHWFRTFSRQELKLSLMDLDIYDEKFDSREMITYLEKEIKHFIREVMKE